MSKHTIFMQEAIKQSAKNIKYGYGGPFGAVIVKNGEIIGRGFNHVLKNNDASAHAEIMAIRNASKKINSFDLSECDLYTSCEPCPMCLMTIKWANIKNIYFASNRKNAEKIGFRDNHLYKMLNENIKTGKQLTEFQNEAVQIMKEWKDRQNKIY